VVGLNSGSSARDDRDACICPFDGKPCDGVWLLGAPACDVSYFGVVKGENRTCPRLEESVTISGKRRFGGSTGGKRRLDANAQMFALAAG
jgi:hypothetical protein